MFCFNKCSAMSPKRVEQIIYVLQKEIRSHEFIPECCSIRRTQAYGNKKNEDTQKNIEKWGWCSVIVSSTAVCA